MGLNTCLNRGERGERGKCYSDTYSSFRKRCGGNKEYLNSVFSVSSARSAIQTVFAIEKKDTI